MSNQYEFPDEPEVFARVIERFRNITVAELEARLERYAREAEIAEAAQAARIAAWRQKNGIASAQVVPTPPETVVSEK